jgi:DnaK suppressor protein
MKMGQLTASQVVSVKEALDALEVKIRAGMHNPLVDSRDENFAVLAGEVHDTGDEAVADELMGIGSALGERSVHELLEIERARQRIAGGEIGECAECAGEIGVKRLLANPVAERCVDCESRREHTYAHGATPRL